MTDFALDRPSWAVMAPASSDNLISIGMHHVFWTYEGDRYRCTGCQLLTTLEEFQTKPECGM